MNSIPRMVRRGRLPAAARHTVAAVGLVAMALVVAACTVAPAPTTANDDAAGAPVTPAAPSTTATPEAVPVPAAADATYIHPVGVEPVNLTVPAMDLTENLIPLGIQANGEMEVPVDYDDVGWFTGGGKPGGFGPTVIAGHVDSRSGPAVFFRLGEMVVGDRFTLTGADGTDYEYEVYKAESYKKAEFPTVAVFGATTVDEVRLITCGGEYNTAIGRYVDNLVVYAKRVDAAAPGAS